RSNAAALSGRAKADAPEEAVGASRRYGNFLGMELGFHYDSAAVVPDGTEAPAVEDEVIDYPPCGRPGHRAPHVWLERDGQRVSTLDLFGPGFTLLTGPASEGWVEGAGVAGKRMGTDVRAHAVGRGGDYADVNSDWAEQYGGSEGG